MIEPEKNMRENIQRPCACAANGAYDVNSYDFELPDDRIAIKPYEKRDEARMLVLSRESQDLRTGVFSDILDYFKSGDMLVLNETKVFKARLYGRKDTGARIELLLLRQVKDNLFETLVRPARRVGEGVVIRIDGGLLAAEIVGRYGEEGVWLVNLTPVEGVNMPLFDIIEKCGHIPLPPYIVKNRAAQNPGATENPGFDGEGDADGYQTVYARVTGSVAAPTAGFHFSKELLGKLKTRGVKVEKVVLHVGIGTFKLVECADIREHKMHREPVFIEPDAYERINGFIKNKGNNRLFCCGTTSVRAIESLDALTFNEAAGRYSAETEIFIYPGYDFKYVDAMITNFHLPKSTLLMMVSAFAGVECIKKAYRRAIDEGFLFYSYGDAMLII